MNLPIALTLFRIVLVPPIMVFLISSSRVSVLIAAIIFIAASVRRATRSPAHTASSSEKAPLSPAHRIVTSRL